MQRQFRKQFWVWLVAILIVVGSVASLPSARLQYHKWRLERLKDRKTRLLTRDAAAIDRFWLALGTPVSGDEFDAGIRAHEAALVRLGFLDQAQLPARMVVVCPLTLETLSDLQSECPWYHAETLASTNLVITACPKMMDRWRQRAKDLGW